MGRIVIDSREMGEIVTSVVNSVGTANSNAYDISAGMEELSATMQEVASAVNTGVPMSRGSVRKLMQSRRNRRR